MNSDNSSDNSNFGLLKISGADSYLLLQGQLTCDVNDATATKCLLAAHCNAKGRIIWLGYLFHYDDAYYISLPQNMIRLAISALKKYALFYKVTVENASNTYSCIASDDPSSIGLSHFKMPDGRFLSLCNLNELSQQYVQAPDNWRASNIERGIPMIYPETSEKYLPHELNLHQLAAISFDKGCYTGQEIIARMHYRGKMKKQLIRATLSCDSCPLPGDEILKNSNSKAGDLTVCGSIIDVTLQQNSHYSALLILDHDIVKTTQLHLANHPMVTFKFENQ